MRRPAIGLLVCLAAAWWVTLGARPPQIVPVGTPIQILTTSITQACTIADTNETDLWTYTLPAGLLNTDGRGVRVTVWYTRAANGNTKTQRLYFGATVVSSHAVADSGQTLVQTATILRTSSTAQLTGAFWGSGASGSIAPSITTPAETLANAIVIKATGQNGTAAANDICFRVGTVEWLR